MTDELTEARERLEKEAERHERNAAIFDRPPAEGVMPRGGIRASEHVAANERQKAADLRTLLAALDQRDAEVERLRLAICGGEDAPGYAMSLPLETILQVQDDNRQTWKRDSELAWDGETANSWKARAQAAEQRLKAVTEALEPFAEQANCYTAADRDTAVDWPTFEVGHFRRARQALAASPQDPAQDPTND